MNFNSLEFLVYCPLVILVHWLLPHRLRKHWLLAVSYLFYMYWNPVLILLLLLSTVIDYFCSRGISRYRERPRLSKLLLLVSVCGNLGLLLTFKYADFFGETVNALCAALSVAYRVPALNLILPVGISFYTFQTMSYTIDVYRGNFQAERNFTLFALYVTFFPQLVAGPIERPENLMPQLNKERHFSMDLLSEGGWLMMLGFFKKVVIADRMAPLVDQVFASPELASGPDILLAAVAFGIQIYCDFSAYSDIARGTSKLLGIDLMENFRTPYAARSIREFWRRWHISLTSWFTDYVYIPLGGSRRGLPRQLLNIMIVFFLSGLWHGADMTFVLWGCIHGIYQITGILWDRCFPRRIADTPITAAFRQLRTFLLVSITWIPFRAQDLAQLQVLVSRLLCGWPGTAVLSLSAETVLQPILLVLCLAAIDRRPKKDDSPAQTALVVFCCVTAIALGWLILLSTNNQNAFIYFQF